MHSPQYEAVQAHQVSLRREAVQDRLARGARKQPPPRRSRRVETGASGAPGDPGAAIVWGDGVGRWCGLCLVGVFRLLQIGVEGSVRRAVGEEGDIQRE
jgi:hypothetical protein